MASNNDTQWDSIWYNATIATMIDGERPFGLLKNGAIATKNGLISWVGESVELPAGALDASADQIDCKGRLVTPGLIDCHTHMVYGGNRAKEFELRLSGASYEEIARAGGGIVSTVAATRAASEEQLFSAAEQRLRQFMQEGVTTVEIKSGYGLNHDDELKMLRVARKLGAKLPLDVVTTFLGAHTTPAEYLDRDDEYIDLICEQILPAAIEQKLVDAVDAFCEGIAFSCEQVGRVFDIAQQHKLPIKLHAEQLSDLRGAAMAAERGALSVDHLEYLHEKDVPILARNNTVAVLLPGAFYFLRESKLPPMEALRKHNVPIAIASDHNPGSSPVASLQLMLNMACTLFHMTPEEALAGVTRNAAKALGLADSIGTLVPGKAANMVLWHASDPAQLSYQIGGNQCAQVMFAGQLR